MKYFKLKDLEKLLEKAKKNNINPESILLVRTRGKLKPLDCLEIEEENVKKSKYEEFDRQRNDFNEIFEYSEIFNKNDNLEENEELVKGVVFNLL